MNQGGRVPPGVPGQPMTNFGNLAPSPIDRWGSKLTLSGSDSASPPVAYSPNSRNSPTVCPGTPGYLAQQVNLLRRMDKIYPSDKSHCTAFSGACGLYRNKMLCERLVGKTRTLLKINGQLKMRRCPFYKKIICFTSNPSYPKEYCHWHPDILHLHE